MIPRLFSVRGAMLIFVTLVIWISSAIARLDTLSPTDYLTLSVECKDTRIKASERLEKFTKH